MQPSRWPLASTCALVWPCYCCCHSVDVCFSTVETQIIPNVTVSNPQRLPFHSQLCQRFLQRCYLGAAQTRCKAPRVCLHGLLCKWRCYLQKTPCSLLTGALMCIGNLLSVLMMLSRCNNSSADSILFIFMQDGGPLEWLYSQFVSQTYIWSLHWMLYYLKVPFNEKLEWEASI